MTWERRWHPLREEWVTITSHRNTRPWSGASANPDRADMPEYRADCHLCPGNRRISGVVNDAYRSVFVFDNDHPAFSPSAPTRLEAAPGIYRNAPAQGVCRVMCYSPRHDMSLAELGKDGVRRVLECWADQSHALAARDDVEHVLIFENKGEIVGVSNPHPHCQIYASNFIFKAIDTELAAMRRFGAAHGDNLFRAIIETERADGRRIIAENDGAIAFVPYFARFPFEVYVAPARTCQYLFELDDEAMNALAAVLSETLTRYDNLWEMSFPYMLVVHQAPADGESHRDYHCHIQIHPPLRGPDLQKFLAGVETGGGHFLNDTAPEDAAAALRSVATVHYRNRAG